MHRILCCLVLAVAATVANDSHTVELSPVTKLLREEAALRIDHHFLEQKKGELLRQAQQAELSALKGAGVITAAGENIVSKPKTPDTEDPVADAKKVLSSWLIQTAPLPPGPRKDKPHPSFVQRALRKAEMEIKVLDKGHHGAMRKVISKLEGLASRPTESEDGLYVLDRARARELARLKVLKAYYEGYVNSDAPRDVVDGRLQDYQCQQDKLLAIRDLDVPKPTPEERSNMCQRMKKRWNTKLRIAQAMVAAMAVAEKHKKHCPIEPEEVHLKVATFKLMAIEAACPDMEISTDEPSERAVRMAIRREIANKMVSLLAADSVTADTWALREAKRTLHQLFQ